MYDQITVNKRKTALLFIGFFLVVLAIGWGLSYYYNDSAIFVFAVIIALIQSWVSYFYSDKIALATSGAMSASATQFPELHHVVENLAITAGLPKPEVYIINDPAPNAFATGRDPKHASVAVTTGLLQLMEKKELEGVLAHELSHVKNYDILLVTVAITLVGVVVLVADIFTRSLWWGGGRRRNDNNNDSGGYLIIIAVVLAVLTPLFAKLMELAISRAREYQADASGVLLTRFPEGLASALKKLEKYERPMIRANRATAHLYINEPFGVDDKKASWLQTIFSTHPPLQERIKRLEQM